MNNEILQIIGKECKVFELQLPCECGGYFQLSEQRFSAAKDIDNEVHFLHICNKCCRQIYVNDVYPKISYRPYGEFIRFGELSVKR